MRADVDAEEPPAIFVVNVVGGTAGANALVLHAPTSPNDVLAGVRSHVVVDVENASFADGEIAIGMEVRPNHLQWMDIPPSEIEASGSGSFSLSLRQWC